MKSPTIVLMTMLVTSLASACASTQPITEPGPVIEAFYEALNGGDLDAAMSFVGQDAKFITFSVFSGQAEIRESLQKSIDRNTRYEVDNIQVEGDTVTWILRASADFGACERPMQAVVQNVKIEFLEGDCT